MTTRNIAELESTLQQIVDDPTAWDQESWICATTACYAGRVALNHGCRRLAKDDEDHNEVVTRLYNGPFGLDYDMNVFTHQGKLVTVREFAQDTLGLTTVEADLLFCGNNKLADLQDIVKGLVNGETVEFIRTTLEKRWDAEDADGPG